MNPSGLGVLKTPHTINGARVTITGAGTIEVPAVCREIVINAPVLTNSDVVKLNFQHPEQHTDRHISFRIVNKGSLAIGNIQTNQSTTLTTAIKAALHTGTGTLLVSNGFEFFTILATR